MRARLGAPGYRQYFFAAGARTLVSFFEWTGAEPVPEKDHVVPVPGPIAFDHVALEVGGVEDLFDLRDRISAAGLWVSEVMDQGFVQSIYSSDPNGVPVEFSVTVPGADFRQVPLFGDRHPGEVALEGTTRQSHAWPEPGAAPPPAERVIYPGAGSEYFHGAKK